MYSIAFLCRILVKEGERVDYLVVFLEGQVEKMRLSKLYTPACHLSQKCMQMRSFHSFFTPALHHSIDCFYGLLSSGCVFGDRMLHSPGPSAFSLFAMEEGSALLLSRKDYLAIISLVYFLCSIRSFKMILK